MKTVMDLYWKYVVAYLVIINLISFIAMGADKRSAVRNERRIPERTLFLIAIIGGSLGSILGMKAFRHKTRHKRFVIGMPLILFVQAVMAFYLASKK